MYEQVEKAPGKKSQMEANVFSKSQLSNNPTSTFVDKRPEAIQMRKLRELANNSPQNAKLRELHNLVAANSVAQKKSNVKQDFGFVDNRSEVVSQRQQQEIANNDLHVSQLRAFQGNHINTPIQRTEKEAKKYVTDKDLWRPPLNLIQLMASLYLECSPEFNSIYEQLINKLPEVPGPPTDGYDPPTIYEVDEALEAEIDEQRQIYGEPMPPNIKKRVLDWGKDIQDKGIDRRGSKSSDGKRKRAKMMNAGGDGFRLWHTKTAPTKNKQKPRDLGKSAFFNQNQGDYFRTSAKNVQKDVLGIESSNKRGDSNFVNALDERYSIENGQTPKRLLNQRMSSTDKSPFGQITYNSKLSGQAQPGPKLGSEINSFTYNLLGYHSNIQTYKPDLDDRPREYLDKDQYFSEVWDLVDQHQEINEDYETELFGHYQQIVSGAASAYGDHSGEISGHKLKLVLASMSKESNFFDYPAVIFEPDDKNNVGAIKSAIIEQWNRCSSIKMTERQSFGFLYPTISDLEKSIRIWPGQYQIEEFLATLQRVITLDKKDAYKEKDSNSGKQAQGGLPLLQNTLKRSMNLATAAVGRVQSPNDKVKLLFNRIASNYGKGLEILRQWEGLDTDALFAETTQIIENLNEAILHLSSEYDQGSAQSSFEVAVLGHYLKHIDQTSYNMDSFYLTHSGQQGSGSAMLFQGADAAFLKQKIKDRGPIYFETMTSKQGREQIKLVDPVYNFTCKEEASYFVKETIKDAQIYDITNLDPAKLGEVLVENSHEYVTLYSSFSKHFQFGTDSTNLGMVIHLRRGEGKKKDLGDYVPKGAVWNQSEDKYQKGDEHVPAVPSQLYHHAALLLGSQTGDGSSGGGSRGTYMKFPKT